MGEIQVPLELPLKTTLEEHIDSKMTFKSKCYLLFNSDPLPHSGLLNTTVLWHKHSNLVLSGLAHYWATNWNLFELSLSLFISLSVLYVCLSVSLSPNMNTNFSAKVTLC